jgi:hypothetical protein
MNFLIFILLSTIDFFSILLLGFVIFRIRFSAVKFKKMLIIGFILSIISYLLNIFSLESVSPIVQLICLVVLFIFTFKEKIKYSILVTCSSYILYGVIQGLLILLLNSYEILLISELIPFTNKAYLLQISTSLLVIIISLHIKRYNGGFSFIPHEPLKKIYRYSNMLLIVVTIVAISTVSYIFYYGRNLDSFFYFLITLGSMLIASTVILLLLLKRDVEDSSF